MTYQSLLRDPPGVVAQIAKQSSAERRPGPFQNITRSTKGDAEKDFRYYRQYYLEQQWREELTSEEIAVINKHLDADLVAYLGYQILF